MRTVGPESNGYLEAPLSIRGIAFAAILVGVCCGPTIAQGGPADLGQWSGVYDWTSQFALAGPDDEIAHAAYLATGLHAGKVLLFNYFSGGDTTRCWLMDPQSPDALIEIQQTLDSNVFCGGKSFRPDGTLLVAGGFPPSAQAPAPTESYVFDPDALGIVQPGPPWPSISEDPWFPGPLTNVPHYYPTLSTLVDINLTSSSIPPFQTAGTTTLLTGGPEMVDNSGQPVWESLEPVPSASWIAINPPGSPPGEQYSLNPAGTSSSYTLLDSYPRALQISTGEIVIGGDVNTAAFPASPPSPPKSTWVIRPPFSGCGWSPCGTWALWRAKDQVTDRNYGSAVLLHQLDSGFDRVLVFGGQQEGAGPTTDSVQEYLRGSNPPDDDAWTSKISMLYPRTFLNAVILPTGHLFLVGGDQLGEDGPATTPELYDPGASPFDSGSTQPLAEPSVQPSLGCTPDGPTPRLYHSVAVLLRDGRVLVAGGAQREVGGEFCGPASEYTGEIYSPPYLFQGSRPTLSRCPKYSTFSPSQAGGVTFVAEVKIPIPGTLDRVVLLRPAAVTHHFDTDQRYIDLDYEVTQYAVVFPENVTRLTLDVEAPWERLGPPGWYMLFAVAQDSSGNRIPSVGQFMHLESLP